MLVVGPHPSYIFVEILIVMSNKFEKFEMCQFDDVISNYVTKIHELCWLIKHEILIHWFQNSYQPWWFRNLMKMLRQKLYILRNTYLDHSVWIMKSMKQYFIFHKSTKSVHFVHIIAYYVIKLARFRIFYTIFSHIFYMAINISTNMY